MQADVERVLIPHQLIAQRVGELAELIVRDHPPDAGSIGALTIVPILTGAMIFCADLVRRMPLPMRLGLMTVSSYRAKSVRPAAAQVLFDGVGSVRGRQVVVVDDILDSGQTLGLVVPALAAMHPASLRVCVLLRKDRPSARAFHVDYVGFDIPDEFVVGYGLDFDDYYRNLPDIVTLKKAVLAGGA